MPTLSIVDGTAGAAEPEPTAEPEPIAEPEPVIADPDPLADPDPFCTTADPLPCSPAGFDDFELHAAASAQIQIEKLRMPGPY